LFAVGALALLAGVGVLDLEGLAAGGAGEDDHGFLRTGPGAAGRTSVLLKCIDEVEGDADRRGKRNEPQRHRGHRGKNTEEDRKEENQMLVFLCGGLPSVSSVSLWFVLH
jgi:hypothetical protein